MKAGLKFVLLTTDSLTMQDRGILSSQLNTDRRDKRQEWMSYTVLDKVTNLQAFHQRT
jgi:hypothetical protein